MTVRELVEMLVTHDEDAEVVIDVHGTIEQGVYPIREVFPYPDGHAALILDDSVQEE
jgi:hypothetical protein